MLVAGLTLTGLLGATDPAAADHDHNRSTSIHHRSSMELTPGTMAAVLVLLAGGAALAVERLRTRKLDEDL